MTLSFAAELNGLFSQGSMMFRSLARPDANPTESADFANAQKFLVSLHKALDIQELKQELGGSNVAECVVSILDQKTNKGLGGIETTCIDSLERFLSNLCDYICKVIKITANESPEESQNPSHDVHLGLVGDYLNFLDKVFSSSYAKGEGTDRHRYLTTLSRKIDTAIDSAMAIIPADSAGDPDHYTLHTKFQQFLDYQANKPDRAGLVRYPQPVKK